jgi:hypothetical protein
MRRVGLMILLLAGCDFDEVRVWSDAPGIEACEEIEYRCGQLEDVELRETCGDAVRDRLELVDRVPGLHRRITGDVIDGRHDSCADAMAYLAAWELSH